MYDKFLLEVDFKIYKGVLYEDVRKESLSHSIETFLDESL